MSTIKITDCHATASRSVHVRINMGQIGKEAAKRMADVQGLQPVWVGLDVSNSSTNVRNMVRPESSGRFLGNGQVVDPALRLTSQSICDHNQNHGISTFGSIGILGDLGTLGAVYKKI